MPVDPDVQTQLTRIDDLVHQLKLQGVALIDAMTTNNEEFVRRHKGVVAPYDQIKRDMATLRTATAAIATVPAP